MRASTLAALSEGEAEEETLPPAPSRPPYAWMWIAMLCGLLALSFLVNLILMIPHGQ